MARRRSNGRRRRRGQRPRVPLWRRIFRNRYNPGSRWVSAADVWENLKATWFSWTHRVPPNSRLLYRNGRVVGYTARWRGIR